MGRLLDELLNDISKDNNDINEQLKIICDEISKEEEYKYLKYHPDGSNFYLTLETKGILKKEIGFLSLEREFGDEYIARLRTIYEPNLKHLKEDEQLSYKISKSWVIDENKPKKILKEFAKILNHLNGK